MPRKLKPTPPPPAAPIALEAGLHAGLAPVEISQSEIATFRDCPLKHRIEYVMLYKKPPKPGSPLHRGSFMHAVLEEFYLHLRDGGNPADAKFRAMAVLEAYETDEEERDLVRWMLDGYFDHYAQADQDQWEVLAVEVNFRIALPDMEGRPSNYMLNGQIDLVVRNRYTNKVWIVDHKSCADLPGHNTMELDIDDQFGLYTAVWNLLHPDQPCMGSIHNAIRTKKLVRKMTPEDRFKRTHLNRTKTEQANILRDAYLVARRMYPIEPELRALPVYSSPNPRQCGWKCGYKEAHLAARSGVALTQALEDFGFTRGQPRYTAPETTA